MQVSAIGIAFYKREDYPRVLEVMADGHKLARTYDEFVKGFETGKRELEAKGHIVVAAVIEPDEFLAGAGCATCRSTPRHACASEVAATEVRKRQRGR